MNEPGQCLVISVLYVYFSFWKYSSASNHMAHQKGGDVFCGRSSKRSAEFPDKYDNLQNMFLHIICNINWNTYSYWINNI